MKCITYDLTFTISNYISLRILKNKKKSEKHLSTFIQNKATFRCSTTSKIRRKYNEKVKRKLNFSKQTVMFVRTYTLIKRLTYYLSYGYAI